MSPFDQNVKNYFLLATILPYSHHFILLAHHAALIFPLAIFLACLALKDLRLAAYDLLSPFFLGLPFTPCCPKRIVLTLLPTLATTTCDFFGCFGVLFGLLNLETPALLRAGCFFLTTRLFLGTS